VRQHNRHIGRKRIEPGSNRFLTCFSTGNHRRDLSKAVRTTKLGHVFDITGGSDDNDRPDLWVFVEDQGRVDQQWSLTQQPELLSAPA
jgi:hypothetical protein